MNDNNFNIIDPGQSHLPGNTVIQKVLSDNDRLPTEQHDKAVRAFFVSDGIASGIGKDLAFVDQIPNFIKEIIDNKLWECLYVAKSVVTPYYCCYTKGTDAENFRAFITAKRPNGLETSVETIDRVLQADSEVQRKFREIIYESRQGERTDLTDETSYGDRKKSQSELSQTQRSVIRAAKRAAEEIPEVADLLDRGLIAMDVAAQLGRDIKDPNNLTAEEREYVDKRDLIGIRLKKYIDTNPIPEDEDREPAYSRELNNYVKDLLGIKDRSKSVRMDNPKKAAEKLLQFYQGLTLQELIIHLEQGLNAIADHQKPATEYLTPQNAQHFSELASYKASVPSTEIENINGIPEQENQPVSYEAKSTSQQTELDAWTKTETTPTALPQLPLDTDTKTNIPLLKPVLIDNRTSEVTGTYKVTERETTELQTLDINQGLTLNELAKRLKVQSSTLSAKFQREPEKFINWSKKRDPEGFSWQRSKIREGRGFLYFPTNEAD